MIDITTRDREFDVLIFDQHLFKRICENLYPAQLDQLFQYGIVCGTLSFFDS